MKYSFQELTETDLEELYEWLNRKHVAEWWDGELSRKTFKKYADHLNDASMKMFFVIYSGRKIAFLQLYNAIAQQKDGWWLNEKAGTWGLDTFIAEKTDLGKGHGSSYIKQFMDEYTEKLKVKKWIIDPDPKNIAAIKAYGYAGFQKKGIIQTPDGKALLMEYIPSQPNSR